jgi:hypothetical protein
MATNATLKSANTTLLPGLGLIVPITLLHDFFNALGTLDKKRTAARISETYGKRENALIIYTRHTMTTLFF